MEVIVENDDDKTRLSRMIEIIVDVANSDFTKYCEISDRRDAVDAISMGINMMIDDIKLKSIGLQYARERTKGIENRIRKLPEGVWEDCDVSDKNDIFDDLATNINEIANELLQNREKLEESRERFSSLSNLLPQTVFEVDKTGNLTYSNIHGFRTFGYTQEDLEKGVPFRNLIHPEDREKTFQNYLRLLKGEMVDDIEYVGLKSNGDSFPINIFSNVILKNSKPGGVRGIVIDISKVKEMQKELTDINEELEDRIASRTKEVIFEKKRSEFYFDLLCHDIGNLHQGILSSCQLAKVKMNHAESLEEILQLNLRLVDRGLKLVRNVKILHNLERRRKDLQEIDLVEAIQESIRECKDIFSNGDLEIIFDSPEKKIHVLAEPIITEIFHNIIHNGIKAQNEEKKKIEINLIEDPELKRISIDIADHGTGISNEMKEKILHRQDIAGDLLLSGIGLTIVNELVKRYKGTIEIKDRVENNFSKGAKFVISFPAI